MEFKQNQVLQEFDRISNLINEFYHEIALKQGLSDSAYEILQAILVLGEGCTQTEIYKYCYLNKQTVNSSVNKLRENDLIDFTKGTGREIYIHFTKTGKELVNEKILPIEQAENDVFEEMTKEEQKEIIRLMNKYLDNFKAKVSNIINE
ncbi:MarR family winged helix-turn-helix transcriptional regulator [Sellimonas intestinalis]|uniref:MarR family winged helix-turn-helix transcriptional regulator n=1 Tax=Sellimonas intestinalis TaxID=1653434 RepID=UPI0015EB3A64|nr:MarR family transcriptional regulator [Sellimonas intestinalis]MBA2214060.1 MarR family transcriptional regulator [Sellimonas intestinalis]